MKLIPAIILALGLLFQCLSVRADGPDELLAQRGKGTLTQTEFTARTDKIPANIRMATLRDRNRLRDVINSMLLISQLTADAREAGFEMTPIVIERMRLAAESELATAWLVHYVNTQPPGDFEKLAFENFQLNQASILSSPAIDVSHILVSTSERADADAQMLADSIYQQAIDDPTVFDELVMEYSEDPSASSNKGSFRNVKKGDMVKAFEETAFGLQAGEISNPVKTNYGYHIIRLDALTPAQEMSFDDVKAQLIDTEQKRHADRIKRDYLSTLNTMDVDMTKDALEKLVERQFDENNIDSAVTGTQTD